MSDNIILELLEKYKTENVELKNEVEELKKELRKNKTRSIASYIAELLNDNIFPIFIIIFVSIIIPPFCNSCEQKIKADLEVSKINAGEKYKPIGEFYLEYNTEWDCYFVMERQVSYKGKQKSKCINKKDADNSIEENKKMYETLNGESK